MRVKSYYGANIKEALQKARRELGTEAAIVASRQVNAGEGLPGAYEVVCGVPDEARRPEPARVIPEATPAQAASAPASAKERTMSRLRKPVDAMRSVVTRSSAGDEFGSDRLREMLLADGFGKDLTEEIIAGVRQRQRALPKGSAAPEEVLEQELSARLAFAPELGKTKAREKIVALVGPPGSGKTTTLVKLAVRYGIADRRPLHVISTDGYRVGGADALRTYCAGMAVPCDVLETATGLPAALERYGDSLILIDTPGFAPADMGLAGPLASVLSRHPDIDVHLVLPAWIAPAAMASTVARFRPFLPSKLLVTGADVVESSRPVAGQALRNEKPISYICSGQAIPEDIAEASFARLMKAAEPGTGTKKAISAA